MIFVSDFRLISRRYKEKIGVPCGKEATLQERYKSLCKAYGESLVVAAFDEWASAHAWKKNPPPSLWSFFNECKQWVDDVREIQEKVEASKNEIDADEAAMIADRVAARKRIEAELEAARKEKEALKSLPKDAF